MRSERAAELRKLSELFGDPKRLVRDYIEPCCQHHNPADRSADLEPISRVNAHAFQVINAFLNGDGPLGEERTRLFVLSDSGMGKSSLLVMLRLFHLAGFWPQGRDCLLLKLGVDTLEQVTQHPNQAGTVLLLDALDEDPLACGDAKGRLLELLENTQQYHRVILSCLTGFFPTTGSDPFARPGRVTVGNRLYSMTFLAPFDPDQAAALVRKRLAVHWYAPRSYANRGLLARAEAWVSTLQPACMRPFLLTHTKEILGSSEREWNLYTLYRALLETWLLARKQRQKEPLSLERLWLMCSALAVEMQRLGRLIISQKQLDELAQRLPEAAYLWDLAGGGRSQFLRQSQDGMQFSHSSLQAFLVAHALARGEPNMGAEKLRASFQILEFLGSTGAIDLALLRPLQLGDLRGEGMPACAFFDRLLDDSPGPTLRIIPAGEYWMGTASGPEETQPQHLVQIPAAFALGAYPVTFREYDYYAQVTGRKRPEDNQWGREERPVINVSWSDAYAYCDWLSEQTDQPYRLPTEAEWEYATRANGGSDYWWGNSEKHAANHAWFRANARGMTHPVGVKPPNPWGLWDMAGNVWEWVQSCWHPNYAGASTDGSVQESEMVCARIVRGGSWTDRAIDLRSTERHGDYARDRGDNLGFRVARSL